jgi:cytochrome c553
MNTGCTWVGLLGRYNRLIDPSQTSVDCLSKMNKFLLSLTVLIVAAASTFTAHAQEVKGNAKDGASKNAMCIGCHGIVGYQASFPEIHKVPMISGQGAPYIVAALTAYKKGERKHPTMRGIAESLTDQDMADLAAYYTASGVVAGAPPPNKSVGASDRITKLLNKEGAVCVACHGDNFNSDVSVFPKIAGQHSDYLFVALKAYKVEGNPKVGRDNAIMAGVAKNFTNAELKELANYIGSLPGDLKTEPLQRFK